jgi:hypothetical protein
MRPLTTGSMMEDDKPVEHVVQFCGLNRDLLVTNVAEFLADGLRKGEGALVIASPEQCGPIRKALEAIAPVDLFAHMDARDALSRFMVSGIPMWNLFEEIVLSRITELRKTCARVRAYGNMVSLLWSSGERFAAIRVEQFWNRLLAVHSVPLFCSYAIDVLDSAFNSNNIGSVLAHHTRVIGSGDAKLERCLSESMSEILGPNATRAIRAANSDIVLNAGGFHEKRASLPKSEAVILWLHDRAPDQATAILSRTRELLDA